MSNGRRQPPVADRAHFGIGPIYAGLMLRRTRCLLVALAALTPVVVSGTEVLAASAPSVTPTVASTVPPENDPASPDGLNDAAEKSKTAPYRIEMFVDLSGMGLTTDPDVPLLTGEIADGRAHMMMDLGVMFADMLEGSDAPPELQGVDLTMEYVVDGTDMYLRAPLLAAVAEQEAGTTDSLAVFTELGDDWGYVDMAAIAGMAPGDIAGTLGVVGADPAAFFELMTNVEGAESIGTEEIRGVSTTGVRADVSLVDLMTAQGVDPTQLDVTGMDDLAEITVPVEVWIDKDGFVRRLVLDLNAETLTDAASAGTDDVLDPTMLGGFDTSMTMEMFDYGAEDIVIEPPTEFVDITDAFSELIASTASTTPGLR